MVTVLNVVTSISRLFLVSLLNKLTLHVISSRLPENMKGQRNNYSFAGTPLVAIHHALQQGVVIYRHNWNVSKCYIP